MKILLKEYENESTITFDKIIDLVVETKYMYKTKIEKNDILTFIDFLITEVGINSLNEIYYYGKNPRVWSYILLFGYIDKNIKLFYKETEIKESSILRLDLKNIGFVSEDLKKELSLQEYERLPEGLKNLYYKNKEEERASLSKLGEIYVKNIKN